LFKAGFHRARVAALGSAWVAGRDQDVLFYNPAQLIGARQGLDVSFQRYGADGRRTTLGGVYAGGKMSFTLGWGVQYASFAVDPQTPYPFAADALFGAQTNVGFLHVNVARLLGKFAERADPGTQAAVKLAASQFGLLGGNLTRDEGTLHLDLSLSPP
jgi:hypothetical protein